MLEKLLLVSLCVCWTHAFGFLLQRGWETNELLEHSLIISKADHADTVPRWWLTILWGQGLGLERGGLHKASEMAWGGGVGLNCNPKPFQLTHIVNTPLSLFQF